MGSLGRLTRIEDMPANKQMLGILRQAVDFVDSGQYTSPIVARSKVVKAPKAAAKRLLPSCGRSRPTKKARSLRAFSPGCKTEYIEWIADAKRDETRDKRIDTAIEWIGEGKQRNWKYQQSQSSKFQLARP